MTDDSIDIENRLKTEILSQYVKKYDIFTCTYVLSWLAGFLVVFLTLRYHFGLRISVSAPWAILAMICVILGEANAVTALTRKSVQKAKEQFLRMFPRGSHEYYVALDILSDMDAPEIAELLKALVEEDRPRLEPSVVEMQDVAPETTPQMDDAHTNKEDLIDLNAGER